METGTREQFVCPLWTAPLFLDVIYNWRMVTTSSAFWWPLLFWYSSHLLRSYPLICILKCCIIYVRRLPKFMWCLTPHLKVAGKSRVAGVSYGKVLWSLASPATNCPLCLVPLHSQSIELIAARRLLEHSRLWQRCRKHRPMFYLRLSYYLLVFHHVSCTLRSAKDPICTGCFLRKEVSIPRSNL